MAWSRYAVRTATGALALAGIGFLGATAVGAFAYADTAPTPRFIAGNVTTCAGAGLTGSILFGGDNASASGAGGSGTVSGDGKTLDVTINAGYTASGIVVKGGDNANAYDGPFAGAVTITGMVSPPVGAEDQNIPQISHWFVCGGTSTTTPPPTTTQPPGSTTEPPGRTTEPPVTTPGTPGDDGGLPVTGTAVGGVVVAGVALVAAGTALLLIRRRRDIAVPPGDQS